MAVTKGTVLFILLFPAMMFSLTSSRYAKPGSYGTSFVFAWPETLTNSKLVVSVLSVTNHTTRVTISIPGTPYEWHETIQPFQDVAKQINQSYIMMRSRDLINVTVKVDSDYDVSVTAVSETPPHSTNSFQVIPVASLGIEYYVPLIYNPITQRQMPGLATVSAQLEDTNINITFSKNVSLDGKYVSDQTTIKLTLKPFQTYQFEVVLSDDDDHVVIMRLTADKSVSVVSGSLCAVLPPSRTTGTCDYLVEQFPPFNQWGRRFTVPSFINRTAFSMLIIAGRVSTIVKVTDETDVMLNRGAHWLRTFSGGGRYVESDKPILVVLFSTTRLDSEVSLGDPSMSIIPPHKQYLNGNQIFDIYSFESKPYMMHYLAVTAACSSMDNFTLDNISLTLHDSNDTRIGNMCVSHVEVKPGIHTFTQFYGSYMLMSYGFDNRVGYSNVISFNTRPITCQSYDDIRDVTVEYQCEDLVQNFCPENETEDGDETILWPKTGIFKTINSASVCPLTFTKAGIPVWSRRCNLTDDLRVIWNDPERNDCGDVITVEKPEDLITAEVTTENVEEVSSTLLDVTQEIDEINSNDVTAVAVTLSKVVETGSSSKTVTESVVQTVDSIITELSEVEVNEGQINTADTSASTSEMVRVMEQQLQQTLEVEDNVTIITNEIQVQAFHVDVVEEPEDLPIKPIEQSPGDVHTSVILPKALFISQETTVTVTFILYRDDALFRPPPSKTLKERNAPEMVLSVSVVTSTKFEKLVHPVILNFPRPQNNKTISNTTSCVFWDFEQNNGVGDWSDKGCTYVHSTNESVICECNHLTNFAVLMDYMDEVEEMSEAYTVFLDVLTKIGCTVSIIGLIVTLCIFFLFKRLRTSRPRRILVHLCIALLCLYMTFLFGIDSAVNSKWACPMVAALIHYFLLCAVFWMGVEAMNIYLMLVRVFNMNISRFVMKGAIAAWGGPLVIVTICMAASTEQYINVDFCFLKPGTVMYIGLITPMALVLFHNIIIFLLVFRNLMSANLAGTVHGKKTDMALLKERLQNALTMTVLMGLTWMFGFLMIGDSQFLFQLLFCLFNSFQGLLVFVLFCWRQEDVRKTLRPHCLSAKRKGKEAMGAKADYEVTSTMTGHQSARYSTEVRKNVTSTGSTSSSMLLSLYKVNNNLKGSVSHV